MDVIGFLSIIISILVFALFLGIAATYKPQNSSVKTYEKINEQLYEKTNKFFNYKKINDFLEANGARYYFSSKINPIKYCAICILLALVILFFAIRLHWAVAIVLAITGYHIPGIILVYLNKSDNEDRILKQLKSLYSALLVQMKAGVYVTDALSECYRRLPSGRLRDALENVSVDIFVKKSFREAIQNFNKKFNNGYIDSLCTILLQAQESGQAMEALNDIIEEMNDMEASLLEKKNEALDTKVKMCSMVMFIIFAVVVVYIFYYDATKMAG